MHTPAGCLVVRSGMGGIESIRWAGASAGEQAAAPPYPYGEMAECARQLEEYFAGRRKEFDLRLAPDRGTEFQRLVWGALRTIPYGHTVSYSALAAMIGRPLATRAVAGACHANPWAIVVPCHRVVGADGSLTGYAGGLAAKKWLLEGEKGRFNR